MDYAITVFSLFSPFYSPLPCTLHSYQHSLNLFMSMGHTYKFFGFSISHTILNLSLSILYLPICFLFSLTFPLFSPLHIPTDNPPCDLHFCQCGPVLVVCLVHFCFCFCFLGSVVDYCEFVVILLFIVLVLFFLREVPLIFSIIRAG